MSQWHWVWGGLRFDWAPAGEVPTWTLCETLQYSLEAVVFLTGWLCSLAPVQQLVLFHGADVPHCGAAEVQGRQRGTGVGAKQVFQ